MNQNEEKFSVYKILSLIFSLLIIIIMFFDIGKKYIEQNIKIFTVESPILFPFLLVLVLLITFVLESVSEIKSSTKRGRAGTGKQSVVENNQGKVLLSIFVFTAISIVYIYLLPILHFLPATSLYMFCIMIVSNQSDKFRNRLVKALIATGITIPIIYYIFYGIFDVILP